MVCAVAGPSMYEGNPTGPRRNAEAGRFGYIVTPGRGAPTDENNSGKCGVLYQIGIMSKYRQSANVDRKNSKMAVPRGGGQAYACSPAAMTWSGAFIPFEPGMKTREKKWGAFVFDADA